MNNYFYFFLFFLFALILSVGLLIFVIAIRFRRKACGDKYTVYECGVDPITENARESYSIRFYLLALVFIVFEVETVFLFPWAVIFDQLKIFGFIEMTIFIAILIFGYIYAWKAKALDFRREIE